MIRRELVAPIFSPSLSLSLRSYFVLSISVLLLFSFSHSTRVDLFMKIIMNFVVLFFFSKRSYSQINGFIINSVLLLRVGIMKIEYPHTPKRTEYKIKKKTTLKLLLCSLQNFQMHINELAKAGLYCKRHEMCTITNGVRCMSTTTTTTTHTSTNSFFSLAMHNMHFALVDMFVLICNCGVARF